MVSLFGYLVCCPPKPQVLRNHVLALASRANRVCLPVRGCSPTSDLCLGSGVPARGIRGSIAREAFSRAGAISHFGLWLIMESRDRSSAVFSRTLHRSRLHPPGLKLNYTAALNTLTGCSFRNEGSLSFGPVGNAYVLLPRKVILGQFCVPKFCCGKRVACTDHIQGVLWQSQKQGACCRSRL